MNYSHLAKIILSPHISEKSSKLGDQHHQFVFKVVSRATKDEIKEAVEKIFNVKVKSVRTTNVKGKKKIFRQTLGKHADWKKAYVTLKEGDINFVQQVSGTESESKKK